MKRYLLAAVLLTVTWSLANAGNSPWTLRFHGTLVETPRRQDELSRGSGVSWEFSSGGGVELAAEYRISERIGLEASVLWVRLEMSYSIGRPAGIQTLELGMVPFTLGVPFHLPAGDRAEFRFGPTVSYIRFLDINSTIQFGTSRTSIDLHSDMALGAAIGLDAAFGQGGWAVSAGLSYQRTTAGGTDIDPLIVSLGFAYRF